MLCAEILTFLIKIKKDAQGEKRVLFVISRLFTVFFFCLAENLSWDEFIFKKTARQKAVFFYFRGEQFDQMIFFRGELFMNDYQSRRSR